MNHRLNQRLAQEKVADALRDAARRRAASTVADGRHGPAYRLVLKALRQTAARGAARRRPQAARPGLDGQLGD
jgi:hypothetical protein